jgi:uncharacterized repeat protein (TIGR01451 family)
MTAASTRRQARHLLTASAVVALIGVPGVAAHANGAGDSNDKQTICHANSSDTLRYVINTPNKNGDVDGHAGHTGPIWNPSLKADHDWWGDIIPPFDYNEDGTTQHFPGLNWDANGQAWFANDCRVPITGSVNKVNDANGDGVYDDDETATSEGADVPFQVTITNTSVVPVVVAELLDTIVDGIIPFTPSPDPVGTTLDPGESVTFTFTVAGYSPDDGGIMINNMAVVLKDASDPDNVTVVDDSSTVRTALPPPAPDVSIVKTGPATVAPGEDLTWTLTVRNDGAVPLSDTTLTPVIITDVLPAGTTLVSATGPDSCTGTTTVTCTLMDLGVGATATFTLVATLDADYAEETVINTAVVTPEDATPDDNTSTWVTDVTTGGGGTVTPPFSGGGGGVTLPRTGTPAWQVAAFGVALLLSGTGFLLVPVALRRRA